MKEQSFYIWLGGGAHFLALTNSIDEILKQGRKKNAALVFCTTFIQNFPPKHQAIATKYGSLEYIIKWDRG